MVLAYTYSAEEVAAFEKANAARLTRQPKPQPAEQPGLVMIKKGRDVERAPEAKAKIKANPAMEKALTGLQIQADETLAFMEAEKNRLRRSRQAKEAQRVAGAKDVKAKQEAAQSGVTVMTEGGKSRTVKRMKTTASKMRDAKTLSRELYNHLQAFALLCAAGTGAAILDQHDSTSRMTGPYEPYAPGGGFGSKTLSDRQLAGISAFKEMRRRIPQEMMHAYCQVVGEEIGSL